jgi:fructose-1,6-bisphosphatase/inositol monophosphatase family enzyme
MESLMHEGVNAMTLLSIVYPTIQIANGKFVGAVFLGVEAHDVAALKIIIEEAGGKVTDVEGNERRYDKKGAGCVMSNGVLHTKILELVKQGKIK